MKEQLISFESAKLAKKKGFNVSVRHFYPDLSWGREELYQCVNVGYEFTHEILESDPNGFGDIILTPTQSLLQKWLREVHGYYVIIIPTVTSDWTFKIINTMKKDSMEVPPYTDVCGQDFYSYEQALEEGLFESLKLIKS